MKCSLEGRMERDFWDGGFVWFGGFLGGLVFNV